jgi:hypothetical protein
LRREVVAGTLAALFGKKGLVLTLPTPDGPLRAKVEPHNAWMPSAWSAGIEKIASQLTDWQAS